MGAADLHLSLLAGTPADAWSHSDWADPRTREELVGPYLAMWNAAAALMIEDALLHLAGSESRWMGTPAERAEACDDLLTLGPITRRFARFCLVDPADLRRCLLVKAAAKGLVP